MSDNGGPAYPVDETDAWCGSSGMTLLDHFAGQALAGMLNRGWPNDVDMEEISRRAYKVGRAMLAERNKETPND